MAQTSGLHTKSLFVLDNGLARPVAGKSAKDIISRGQILKVSPDGDRVSSVLADSKFLHLPDGIAYSAKHGRLYFTNMGIPSINDGSVLSIRVDGTDPQTILDQGKIHTPKQVALDMKNDKLYISDREGLRVIRCNLDGTDLETLIQTGNIDRVSDARDSTKWCVGVATSPRTNLFYWTQKGPSKGSKGRIFCAPMDNTSKREPICILDNLPEPIDLYIHEESNTLYWTDRGELPYGNTFNKLLLDNSGTRPAASHPDPVSGIQYEIIVQNFDEAIGLTFDLETGRWYVSDIGGTIWSFDVNGGRKTKVYEDKSCAFTGIVMATQER